MALAYHIPMLKAGFSKLEITPPLGVPMDGYADRVQGAASIHDPLYARCVALDNGTNRIAWLIVDIIGLNRQTCGEIRNLVKEIDGHGLMISGTHTHGGPCPWPSKQEGADHQVHKEWLSGLASKLAQTVDQACAQWEPVELYTGKALAEGVSINRRFTLRDGKTVMEWNSPKKEDVVYTGPIDPRVCVLGFKTPGRKEWRAILGQFSCHATIMGQENLEITADWPGQACKVLSQAHPGAWTAVAQGCCGNINPSDPKGAFEDVVDKGTKIAQALGRALDQSQPLGGREMGSALVSVKLPSKKGGADIRPSGDSYEGMVQALRVGQAAMVGIPGEPFVDISLELKRHSLYEPLFVGGYTNDYNYVDLGYIPTAPAYFEGAYEIASSHLAQGSDRLVVQAALKALERLGLSE